MKLKELMASVPENQFDGELKELSDLVITGISCDSRKVAAGQVFVCIDGVSQDGHLFAQDAIVKGAAVLITERDTGISPQIIVKNARAVYSEICAAWFGHPAKDLKLIGVTGTNGKTTVSYLLKSILEKNGCKTGLIGTIQNMIGDEVLPAKNTTPNAYELHSLFYLMKSSGCQYAVMEVSSHALDQDRVWGLEFESALFTNLTQDHLDYHKSMDNYLAAKKKLFGMCRTAIINFDDEYAERLTSELSCQIKTYSAKSEEADYIAKNVLFRADGVDFEMIGYGVISRVKLKTGGEFSVYNALCAGTCAIALGFPLVTVCEALSEVRGVKGRAEVVPSGRDFTIIIDYAHTPDGLKNVLETFHNVEKNRLIVLFGCGGDRDRTKRPLMGSVAADISDFVIVTSDNPRSEDPDLIIKDILKGMEGTETPYTVIENRVDAINYAVHNAQPNDIIVLAGKGHETYQILSTGTIHLDEREVIAEALKSLDV